MDEAFCATQVWIWDSCFMSLFCKYAKEVFPGVETLNNFYENLYGGKRLPKIICPDNEPSWTGNKPGELSEILTHIADNPPLFAWAEYENALISGDKEHVKELLTKKKVLQKHYEWFENLKEPTEINNVLCPTCLISEKYGYKWEGGRSGMDNTPRGRRGEHAVKDRPNNPDMYWFDAICQQAMAANMISKLFLIIDDEKSAAEWREKYEEKKEIANELYWDNEDNFYYDIDCNTHDFYKVMTMASFWALTAEIAPEDRAKAIAKHTSNPETFGGIVPFVSLSRSDNDYVSTGKYWRGGVWLPTAYAALKGFVNYGYFGEAHKAATKLLNHMCTTYFSYTPHTIWESYNPEECKPTSGVHENEVRKDFCGWSALGPISIYIEHVLGFHTTNAFEKTLKWAKPSDLRGKFGIKNFRFGNIVTDIISNGDKCTVVSNENYTLEINDKKYDIKPGKNIL